MRVGELIEANRRLEARVAELEQRLNRSSRNSSLPPSQDPPSAPPRPRRPVSGRKRGGQPGHEGRHRRLLPPERVDEVVEHWPERCQACARVFAARELVDAAEPWRYQVAELPLIAVRVSEHRLHAVCCPECSTPTRAELPRRVPRSAFGPRLQAAVVTLAVRNRVSRRFLGRRCRDEDESEGPAESSARPSRKRSSSRARWRLAKRSRGSAAGSRRGRHRLRPRSTDSASTRRGCTRCSPRSRARSSRQ